MSSIKLFLIHPLFYLGLLIRLALIIGLAPLPPENWYVPFLDAASIELNLDPWSLWLMNGGSAAAFPYGYTMWAAFLPLTILFKLFEGNQVFAYFLTLLISDILLLVVLSRILLHRIRLLLVVYWLSPIVILATYGLGLNDLIPILLLTIVIYCVKTYRFRLAGALSAAAISAKFSMVVALPFLLIFLYNNRPIRQKLIEFFLGMGVFGTLFFGPFVFSNGGIEMLMGNPEMSKIYLFAFNIGHASVVYALPLVYLLMVYYAWRIKRLNFDLFQGITGLAFLTIVFMTPASPGWYVWVVPFLVMYQAKSGRTAIMLTAVFSFLYVLINLIYMPLRMYDGSDFQLIQVLRLENNVSIHLYSLLMTGMVALGVILALRVMRQSISQDNYFRLSRKPFVIGVAGDSGSGKDTYADAITGLFGQHSVAKLSGDDYHLWDRQKPMWQVMTHLNPMANELERFSSDLVALIDGKSIYSRRYDHKLGKMTKYSRLRSNDFIIASGLHALYLPILRECYNLKVYLDIDESLRRYFKLQRDVYHRGYSQELVVSSILKRESDAENFIRPQVQYADLILSLQPIQSIPPQEFGKFDQNLQPHLKLVVRTRLGFNELSLTRVLVGVCGLHLDVKSRAGAADMVIVIEGDVSSEDIELAAQMLCPSILEFLDIEPNWQSGVMGLMQLVTLSHINQVLTKRII